MRDFVEEVSYSCKTLWESFLLEVLKENQTKTTFSDKNKQFSHSH
jgi:hypothetical protein